MVSVGAECGSCFVMENCLKSHKQSATGNGRTHWHLGFQCFLVVLPWAGLFCLQSLFLHYSSLTGETQLLYDPVPLQKPLGQPQIDIQLPGWMDTARRSSRDPAS